MIIANPMEYVSVSKVCNKQKLSVKRVLGFLSSNGVIPKRSQRYQKKFVSNSGIVVISTGDSLRVIENDLMNFLSEKGGLPKVLFKDELNEMLDTIEDPKFRFEKINAVTNGRLAFIDAEFRNGNYHEVAWEIREAGKVVEKHYYIVREDYVKKFKGSKTTTTNYGKIDRLQEYKQDYTILSRKHINRIMRQSLRTADYIIAHNAYGERQMLVKNGIKFEKSKYLCTSKMALGYIYDRSPSLSELVDFYDVSMNSNFAHYAHEDARVAAEVFYAMVTRAKREFNIN